MPANMGAIVAKAWDDVQAEEARRDDLQITSLHRLRRARNGQWIDDGPRRPTALGMAMIWRGFDADCDHGDETPMK